MSASFKELRNYLPHVEAMQDAVKQLPVPIAVAIAGKDALILPYQVEATAEYFGVEPMLLPGVAHDLMLVSPLTAFETAFCPQQYSVINVRSKYKYGL